MTRKAFIKKYFWRFAVSLTLAGLIVYTVYHVFASSSGSLLTTPARKITDHQIISGEAYLFREETVLTVSHSGVVNDLVASGEKIGKNVTLAEVWTGYGADELEAVQTELDQLNRLIAVLESSKLSAGTSLSKAELYRAEAMKTYLEIHRSVDKGEWSDLQQAEDDMLTMLNRYAALTDPNATVTEQLDSLKERRRELLRGNYTTLQSTDSSGYFYDRTYVDGYETLFTLPALENLTAEGFASLVATQPQATQGFAAGKMVYGNTWYLAIAFETGTETFFAENDAYTVCFPENESCELKLNCDRILTSESGGVVIVFSSDDSPADFSYLRQQSVEITVGSCSGYYVPDAAMRTENGVEGVYVFEDSAVYFRRVEVLYRGDGYSIVAEQGELGAEYLALNDLMVTSGDNLYHGKVFQ